MIKIGTLEVAAASPEIKVQAKCAMDCKECEKEDTATRTQQDIKLAVQPIEDKQKDQEAPRRSQRTKQYIVPVHVGGSWSKIMFYPKMERFGPTLGDFPEHWSQQESVDALVRWFWKLCNKFEREVLKHHTRGDSRKFIDKRFGAAVVIYDKNAYDLRFAKWPFTLKVGPTADWATYVLRSTGIKIRHANVQPVDVRDLHCHYPEFYNDTGYSPVHPHVPNVENKETPKLALPVYLDLGQRSLVFYPDPVYFGSNREQMLRRWPQQSNQHVVKPLVAWFWSISRQYDMLRYYADYKGNGPLVSSLYFGQAYVLDDDSEEDDNVTNDPWESGLQLDIGSSSEHGTHLVKIERATSKEIKTKCTRIYHEGAQVSEDSDDEWSETESETSELIENPETHWEANYGDDDYGSEYEGDDEEGDDE